MGTHADSEPTNIIQRFFAMESSGGILLMVAAILAMICANSSYAHDYEHILEHSYFTIGFSGDLKLSKSLIHWINDGLMAIFFFLVGMEIKREMVEGELSSRKKAILPFLAAIGGVALPALIFTGFNIGNAQTISGWAIPAATDIAFALGLLALFGSRVPISLKIFLTAVAVIDDLMAVVIIALFYTAHISVGALLVTGGCFVLLLICNLRGVNRLSPYVIIGLVMWVAVLKSGVHATIAGVVLGFLIPLKTPNGQGTSMLKSCEHALHGWVAFIILPIFAFANAGVSFAGLTVEQLADPVPLGIACGLFFGKQFGIFAVSYSTVRMGLTRKPEGATWPQFYAICIMCGIGFTMSLFIGNLAYSDPALIVETKLGVILGSVTSGVIGYLLLKLLLKQPALTTQAGDA